MRTVDGIKIAFVASESYFLGFNTPSMASTAKAEGADMVILMEPGTDPEALSDDDIRALLKVRSDHNIPECA